MKTGLFIGIGGSGVKTLVRLKVKMFNSYKNPLNGSPSRENEFYKENSFIFIDTDYNDIKKIQDNKSFSEQLGDLPILPGEFIAVGSTIPSNVYSSQKKSDTEDSSHFSTWFIDEKEGDFRPTSQSLTNGAGAMRMSGRTTIFMFFPQIKDAIQNGIKKLVISKSEMTSGGNSAANLPSMWLISGSNGGTGSSMILDILYMMDRFFVQKFSAEPLLRLALFAPEPYCALPINQKNLAYPLNSFSTLWELNEFKVMCQEGKGDDLMNNFFVNSFFNKKENTWAKETVKQWNPYTYSLVFDTEDKLGTSNIKIDDHYENVANILYLLTSTAAGEKVNSDMDNLIKGQNNLSKQYEITVNNGNLLDNKKWHRSTVASGSKTIAKPNSHFENFAQKRFLYDILEYGILGDDFSTIHFDSIASNIVINNYINENIKSILELEFLKSDKINFEDKILNERFNTITIQPEPQKTWKGIGGYEDGALSFIFNDVKNGIDERIIEINSEFNSQNSPISKYELIDLIKSSLRKTLTDLISKYGLNYIHELIYKIDVFIESKILPQFSTLLNENYNNTIEKNKLDSCLTIASTNKDYVSLTAAFEDYFKFKREKTVIERKIEIYNLIAAGSEGYLDKLYVSNGGKSGLTALITKFKAESDIAMGELRSLSTEFLRESKENSSTYYFPQLTEMIDLENQGWKKGSEFEVLYQNIVPLDEGNKNTKGAGIFGTPPVRNLTEKSLQNHIANILELLKNNNYFIEFAEQNEFEKNPKNIKDFKEIIIKYINSQIKETDAVNDWLNNTNLYKLFTRFRDESEVNSAKIASFRQQFLVKFPIYLPISSEPEGTSTLFSGSLELKKLAALFGYVDGADYNHWHDSNDDSKLEVFKYEAGHSMNKYKHINNYVAVYEKERNAILALKYACHVHKGFVNLDLVKALKSYNKSNETKTKLVEFAFYDIILYFINKKNPAIYNQMFIQSNYDSFSAESGNTLPLLQIEKSNGTDAVIKIKGLEYDKELNKVKISDEKSQTLTSVSDFSTLMQKSAEFNDTHFEPMIKNLKNVFSQNKEIINNEIQTIIVENFNEIKKEISLKIAVPNVGNWSMVDKIEIPKIGKEIDLLKENNIFK